MNYPFYTAQMSAAPYVFALIALLVLCALLLVALMVMDSDEDTSPVRAYQRLRMATTLMPRMLKQRGVDVAGYFRAASVPGIKSQIANCRHCRHKFACSMMLRAGPCQPRRFDFCANLVAVDRYLAGTSTRRPVKLQARTEGR